jgi:hypothetical protein
VEAYIFNHQNDDGNRNTIYETSSKAFTGFKKFDGGLIVSPTYPKKMAEKEIVYRILCCLKLEYMGS